jgi:hypothetical protein
MSSHSAIWPAFRRTALVCGLCLLALSFAMEAKMAWYGPSAGLGSGISAAKAWPADMPRVVNYGVPTPDPVHPRIPFAVLAVFTFVSIAGADHWERQDPLRGRVPVVAKAYFSPFLFFRPPPALA